MAEFRNKETGEIKTETEWKLDFAQTMSIPTIWNEQILKALNLEPIFESPKPETGDYEVAIRDGIILDSNNNWVYAWKVESVFKEYVDDNNVTHTIEEQLSTAKANRLNELKTHLHTQRYEAMAAAKNAGFMYNDHEFDSDSESRFLINGAVTMALVAKANNVSDSDFIQSMNGGWRSKDGNVSVTSIDGIIALGKALSDHIAACDSVSQNYKTLIDAAINVDDLESIDVTVGY